MSKEPPSAQPVMTIVRALWFVGVFAFVCVRGCVRVRLIACVGALPCCVLRTGGAAGALGAIRGGVLEEHCRVPHIPGRGDRQHRPGVVRGALRRQRRGVHACQAAAHERPGPPRSAADRVDQAPAPRRHLVRCLALLFCTAQN